MLKKISASILALVMVLSLCAGAMAADGDGSGSVSTTTLDANGEQGVFKVVDTPISQDKTLILEKEITAYNVDETTINAPTISYTYTIEAATVGDDTAVTDSADHHAAGTGAVTVPVKAGVGTPTISDHGVVAWTNSETMTATSTGAPNKKSFSIDFSSVAFTGPGVYRYKITENLTGTTDTYAAAGVTETTAGTGMGSHERYIDVYVRPKAPTPEGTTADDPGYWDIYGFTCFYNNTSITDSDKASTAVKTTGFVPGTTGGSSSTAVKADSYYTFNLTLTKTVVNDAYSAANVSFPFTVIFTNNTVTKSIAIIGKVENATVTGWIEPEVNERSGIALIKSGGQIKFIGIPNGTSVEVYETNTATGVTYKVETALTTSSTTTTTDQSVNWHAAPERADSQTTKQTYQSTKATFSTTADADDDNDYTVAITNTLVTISPTGVALRVAPYVLILTAGVALLLVSRRRKAVVEE